MFVMGCTGKRTAAGALADDGIVISWRFFLAIQRKVAMF